MRLAEVDEDVKNPASETGQGTGSSGYMGFLLKNKAEF